MLGLRHSRVDFGRLSDPNPFLNSVWNQSFSETPAIATTLLLYYSPDSAFMFEHTFCLVCSVVKFSRNGPERRSATSNCRSTT